MRGFAALARVTAKGMHSEVPCASKLTYNHCPSAWHCQASEVFPEPSCELQEEVFQKLEATCPPELSLCPQSLS